MSPSLLELFREQAVSFEQAAPLAELTVRWTGGDDHVMRSSDFDEGPDAAAPGDGPDQTEEAVE